MPQTAQTTRHMPTLPEYLRAAVGDINMPEPIITPTMILTEAKRPIFRFNPTSDCSSLIAAVFRNQIKNGINKNLSKMS